eukprot:Seg4269.4 transcript_id=Seg4269.4/GoldUCD/mRNA.D3Y31 product="Neuronal acetylcholine receptor subunit alpha-3" protein_id=Seg4269.4/GoldUCD/D3Y31
MDSKITERVVFILILFTFLKFVVASNLESKILADLLTGYDANARPSSSNNKPLTVQFDIRLNKIVKLDMKEQELVINARVMMAWIDPELKWDKSKYNGTQYLIVPNDKFWTPDILLHNTASDTSMSARDVYKANLRIHNTGTVIWMSPVTLRSSCDVDVRWFPFDTQSCTLTFGSISQTNDAIQLKFFKQPVSISEFRGKFSVYSGVWSFKSLASNLTTAKFECCLAKFSLIEFTLAIRRMPLYYVLYIVLPCLCLSIVSLFAFFISPDTGERAGYSITVVLAMSVYLLVISEKLPEKSDKSPLIGVMYAILFFIMNGTLVAVVFTTHLAFKTTKPPRKLCDLFCSRCRKKHRKQKEVAAHKSVVVQSNPAGNMELEDYYQKQSEQQHENEMHRRGPLVKKSSNIQREFAFLTPEEEKERENQDQWKEIAGKIDRISFWVFFVMTVGIPVICVLLYMA